MVVVNVKMAAPMCVMRVCCACKTVRKFARITTNYNTVHKRYASSDPTTLDSNHAYGLDPAVDAILQRGDVKHRHHPGVMNVKRVKLPQRLVDNIQLMIDKYPTNKLYDRSSQLFRYLWSRQLAAEQTDIERHLAKLQQDYMQQENIDVSTLGTEERTELEKRWNAKATKHLQRNVYHWQPMQYTAYKGFLYLVSRMGNDYSALYQIFNEIDKRLPDFRPKTMFDFGSGVGSSVWAANTIWGRNIIEYYCVDASADMNTIARLLLQDGEEEKPPRIPGVYFRQFIPPSSETRYDVVVSAFSLMELSSLAERLSTVLALWRKADRFLVLVENGSNAGYQAVLQARDFILQLADTEEQKTAASSSRSHGDGDEATSDALIGHVFAPCPHDQPCPRFQRRDRTPCNFNTSYYPLKVDGKMLAEDTSRFSYIVLEKGRRDPTEHAWPRIVRQPTTPSKRINCQMCTADGHLQTSVFTAKKHGKDLYWCARTSKWGDLLPVVKTTLKPRRSRKSQPVSDEQLVSMPADGAENVNEQPST